MQLYPLQKYAFQLFEFMLNAVEISFDISEYYPFIVKAKALPQYPSYRPGNLIISY